MAEQEMAGEDASLDVATDKLVSIGLGNMIQDVQKLDRLEDGRGDIDVTEADGTTDLDKIERDTAAQTESKAEEAKGDGEDAEAGETAETFIELPSAEEGKEGERIPLAEAIEAIQFKRQFDGDAAKALIEVEEKAYAKHDEVTTQLTKILETAQARDSAILQALLHHGPQPPHPALKDERSEYYNPSEWLRLNDAYQAFLADFNALKGEVENTGKARQGLNDHTSETNLRREHDRIARYIPEWKDEKGREAFKAKMLDTLGKRFGVTKEDVDDIIDHKAWRIMQYAADAIAKETKAPEVRKAIQEKAPKLVNGEVPRQRDSSGRFVTEARGRLKQSGSEDDFVNFLLAGKSTPARR